MNLNFNLSQNSSLSQQLNLAPQLLQWLKILQTPSQQLQEIVSAELESNPALEINTGDELPIPEVSTEPVKDEMDFSESDFGEKLEALARIDEDWRNDGAINSSFTSDTKTESEKHDFLINSNSSGKTLYQHLHDQMGTLEMNESDRTLAEIIIGCIDEKGYLSVPLSDLATDTGTSLSKLEIVLAEIQQMDPVGVGARDLRECLLLQLELADDTHVARTVVANYLEPLARGLYGDIARELGVAEHEVYTAHTQIKALHPHPGRQFDKTIPEYIEADIEVQETDGKFDIHLQDQRIPRLKISTACRQLLKKGSLSSSEMNYIKSRIRAASFLIEGIQQREQTIRKVTEQIIHFQQEFFQSGSGELKPLTMAKIGRILKVHETTVSRAIANKYIRTPKGLFPMRQFFVQGYRSDDGSSHTANAVKRMIQSLVRNEETPLRDVDIAAALRERGIKVARRTIAKYREESGIPSSKERCTATRRTQPDTQRIQYSSEPAMTIAPPIFAVV
jgi:RNA polymerase sigma-54 factor